MLESALASCRPVSLDWGGWTLLRIALELEERRMWQFSFRDTKCAEEMAVVSFESDAKVSSCWTAEFVVCLRPMAVLCHGMGSSLERQDVAWTEEHSGLLACWVAESVVCFEEEAGFYHMTAQDSGLEKVPRANCRPTSSVTGYEHAAELDCKPCRQAIGFAG